MSAVRQRVGLQWAASLADSLSYPALGFPDARDKSELPIFGRPVRRGNGPQDLYRFPPHP